MWNSTGWNFFLRLFMICNAYHPYGFKLLQFGSLNNGQLFLNHFSIFRWHIVPLKSVVSCAYGLARRMHVPKTESNQNKARPKHVPLKSLSIKNKNFGISYLDMATVSYSISIFCWIAMIISNILSFDNPSISNINGDMTVHSFDIF